MATPRGLLQFVHVGTKVAIGPTINNITRVTDRQFDAMDMETGNVRVLSYDALLNEWDPATRTNVKFLGKAPKRERELLFF